MPRPYGKWIKYSRDGTLINPAGLYRGDEKQWDRLVSKKPIKDFQYNEPPLLNFFQNFSDWFEGTCCCSSDQNLESEGIRP